MPSPINQDTIKITWENNADTPVTSSNLSKDVDYVASYRDFQSPFETYRGSTIFQSVASEPLRILMKREVIISVINRETRVPVNKQYKLFDTGLEDLWIRIEDMDDDPNNPVTGNWGANNEWFIYMCDPEDELSGQLLVSRSNVSPQQTQVLGISDGSALYTSKNSRLLGGFKSDINGDIIQDSVWDIAGKFADVKAKKYYILDEYSTDSEDPSQRHLYRQLRVSDLDTNTGSNIFSGDVSITGNISSDTATIPDISTDKLTIVDSESITHTLSSKDAEYGVYLKKESPGSISNRILTVQSSNNSNRFVVEDNGSIKTSNKVFEMNTEDTLNVARLEVDLTNPTGSVPLGYDGDFYATRVHNAIWNDLAEFFLSKDEAIPGKVYAIYDNSQKLELAKFKSCKRVVGVCSDSYGMTLKKEYEKDGVAIALSGTVRACTTSKIKFGDEVVSDKDANIKKASFFDRVFNRAAILGKAIEESKDDFFKRILIKVY